MSFYTTWVKPGKAQIEHMFPVYPHKRSSARHLFDHLVGERKQLVRHGEAERFGGRLIDHKLAKAVEAAPIADARPRAPSVPDRRFRRA